MIGEPLFDTKEMFRHACAFCECADMAMEKFQHEIADISWYDIPAGVNSAFACEVFLKAILKFKGIDYCKGHDLKEFFEQLPNDIYDFVKNTTIKNYGSWCNALGIEYLDNISKAFVDWRYIYEHDFNKGGSVHFEHGFLIQFRNALREVCCQLLYGKTWEEWLKGDI